MENKEKQDANDSQNSVALYGIQKRKITSRN